MKQNVKYLRNRVQSIFIVGDMSTLTLIGWDGEESIESMKNVREHTRH